ncbi:MAG TPA: DUF3524 domain-containing protein [Actinobacteria bacterium]|nr:DUF3524 domain-containing protein [Actinomycetota bacterium]
MRVLLVEPYHGGSHRAWAEGYAARSRHDVLVVTHEARFWKWRMHGSQVTLATAAEAVLGGCPPDVVVVSAMTDVAGFVGLARRCLAGAPVIAWFHESQFSYPPSPRDRPDLSYPLVNWTSAVAADAVVFNSEYHRRDFLAGARRLLRRFPDHRHGHLVDAVGDRSTVLPVGIDLARFARAEPREAGEPPLVVWNHRWEHDKDPDAFVAAIEALRSRGVRVRVAVIGERFVSTPASLARLPGLLGEDLVEFGYVSDTRYAELLRSADVVVSTARHEFFGVGVAEAIAAGAFPVLPDRLVYPERIPEPLHRRCLYRDEEELVELLARAVTEPPSPEERRALHDAVVDLDWSRVAPRYDAFVEDVVAARGDDRARRRDPTNRSQHSP